MNNTKITRIRLLIIFAFFLFLSFGGYWLGTYRHLILPIVDCEYVGGGITRASCLSIIKLTGLFTLTGMLSIAFTVFLAFLFGRLWCGYVCPVAFIQDVLTLVRKKLKIAEVRFSPKLAPVIALLKWYVVFYLFFYDPCDLCPIPYITALPTAWVSYDNTPGILWATVLITLSFINDKAFCKFCPIGALVGLTNKKSGSRMKKCGNACTHCRACSEACPMGIQEVYEDRKNEDITHPDCIFCMKCIEVCPEKGALRYEFLGKKIIESKRYTKA